MMVELAHALHQTLVYKQGTAVLVDPIIDWANQSKQNTVDVSITEEVNYYQLLKRSITKEVNNWRGQLLKRSINVNYLSLFNT